VKQKGLTKMEKTKMRKGYQPVRTFKSFVFKGITHHVPVCEDQNSPGSFSFSTLESGDREEFFFTQGHGYKFLNQLPDSDSWVPVTQSLPQMVVARPGVEDGIVDTLEKVAIVYWQGMTLIADPKGGD
jgi:hypothetical protein